MCRSAHRHSLAEIDLDKTVVALVITSSKEREGEEAAGNEGARKKR